MNNNKIKYKEKFFSCFSFDKNNLFQKREYFKINSSKPLLIIELFFLIEIIINIALTKSLNDKRNIISHYSSIKLKIENSGVQKIFFSGTYEWCDYDITPDEIYINGVNQSEIKSEYNFEQNNNEITLIWHNLLRHSTCMFRDCTSITEIDLSNFDDSELIHMHYMFLDCHSLKKIEMSNIKANKVNDAGFLFGNCYQIESINLANFDLNNNAQFHYMFDNCQSLISLNFPNFNKKNIENIFRDCNNLKYINIENAIINNEILSIFYMINSNQIICTHSPKLISIIKSKSAMLNCTNNYCLNQIEGDDCFSLNFKYQYKNKFYEYCPDGTYNDNYNCIDCDEKCYLCSKESTEQNLCISCNNSNNYYEKYNNLANYKLFKDCFKSPKGFYLDTINLLYRQCYYTCDSCNINGNENAHNCNERKNGYKFELKLNDYFNCFSQCPYYYFIEKENNNGIRYQCTLNSECPENYNKLISNLSKCIDKCENENNYKYEYKNKCFSECPEGTMKNEDILKNEKNLFL